MTSAPRLEACYFGDQATGAGEWLRLARVLAHTATMHCPDWQVAVRQIHPRPVNAPIGGANSRTNAQKLEYWTALVLAAPIGTRLVLLDADMFLVGLLDPIWDLSFDVAYTIRPAGVPWPLNGGFIALRVSLAVQAFFHAWRGWNRRLLTHPDEYQRWRQKYAGMNQAAFGALLESLGDGAGVTIVTLPCSIWNCEDFSWAAFDPAETRVVHVKGALRLAVFGQAPPPAPLAGLAQRWHALDREVGHAIGFSGSDVPGLVRT